MEFVGVIKEVTANEPVTSKGKSYDKVGILVAQEGVQYPESIGLILFGDKVQQYPVSVGQKVKAKFNARCNSHNGKLYNELQCWKIEILP